MWTQYIYIQNEYFLPKTVKISLKWSFCIDYCIQNILKPSKHKSSKDLTKLLFLLILLYTKLLMEEAKQVIRVSVSEAARLFGVNPQTIRRAIKDQDINYVVVAGRYKIDFESLVKWSQRKTTVRNKSNKQGIGQFVGKWNIKNTLYSPSSKRIKRDEEEPKDPQ